MAELQCACCGAPIDWPPLDYGSAPPLAQIGVTDNEIRTRVERTRDVCIIDGQTFLIRGNAQIPIVGRQETFAWGVWCSLSEKSFYRVEELWDSQEQLTEPPFFAWLLTNLPCYSEPTSPVKARLHLRGPRVTPYIEVWPEHQLGREQIEGITMDRVWEFARKIVGDNPPQHHQNYSPHK